jgi:hypothetical protein
MLDAPHDARETLLRDAVVNPPPVAPAPEQTAVPHQDQMLRGNVALNPARLRQLPDRKFALQKHLHHPKSMGMGEGAKALGRFGQGIQGDQVEAGWGSNHHE